MRYVISLPPETDHRTPSESTFLACHPLGDLVVRSAGTDASSQTSPRSLSEGSETTVRIAPGSHGLCRIDSRPSTLFPSTPACITHRFPTPLSLLPTPSGHQWSRSPHLHATHNSSTPKRATQHPSPAVHSTSLSELSEPPVDDVRKKRNHPPPHLESKGHRVPILFALTTRNRWGVFRVSTGDTLCGQVHPLSSGRRYRLPTAALA